MERFLYRLSKSHHKDKFILKGALLLTVWQSPISRPTRDIDLLGITENNVENIIKIVKEICSMEVEQDGITFDGSTISGESITENADYEGVRIKFSGSLGSSRITMQLDIGFGDKIVPKAEMIHYFTILDLPVPILFGYSKESTIAEKLEAMVKFGSLNSRMKDFYDIWLLSRQFDFHGGLLTEAISKTFTNRKTKLPSDINVFLHTLLGDPLKERQWNGFIRSNRLEDAPHDFKTVINEISNFLVSPVKCIIRGTTCNAMWKFPNAWIE